MERRTKEKKIRRELSYPLGSERMEYQDEIDTVFVRSSENTTRDGSVKKKNRKASERSNTVRVTRKGSAVKKDRESTETWATVVGRRKKKNNNERKREETNSNKRKEAERITTRKKNR